MRIKGVEILMEINGFCLIAKVQSILIRLNDFTRIKTNQLIRQIKIK